MTQTEPVEDRLLGCESCGFLLAADAISCPVCHLVLREVEAPEPVVAAPEPVVAAPEPYFFASPEPAFVAAPELIAFPPPEPEVIAPPPEPEVIALPPEPVVVAPEPAFFAPPEPAVVAPPEPVVVAPPEPVVVAPPEPTVVAPSQPVVVAPSEVSTDADLDAPGSYALRRRVTPVQRPELDYAMAWAPAPPLAEPIPGSYVPAPPPDAPEGSWPAAPGFDDYVHPDITMQWKRRRAPVGVWISIVLVIALVAAGGGYLVLKARHANKNVAATGLTKVKINDSEVQTAVDAGVPYSSKAGHFTARFPNRPDTQDATTTIEGKSLRVNAVGDKVSRTVVETLTITAGTPAVKSDAKTDLRDLLAGYADSLHMTSKAEVSTTVDGRAARVGEFVSNDGSSFTMLGIEYSGTRFYMLMAPTGVAYAALKKSFAMLP